MAVMWLAASSILGVASADDATGVSLFDAAEPGGAERFAVVNDGVMGGLSSSSVALEGGALVFAGTVRLENRGGFASMRTSMQPLDLAEYAGVEVVVRGDGRRYKLNLRDEDRFDGVVHRAPFETRPGERVALRLPFDAFEPSYRGRRVPDAPPLDRRRIQQLGVLVSDGQAGEFRLELFAVRAYR